MLHRQGKIKRGGGAGGKGTEVANQLTLKWGVTLDYPGMLVIIIRVLTREKLM